MKEAPAEQSEPLRMITVYDRPLDYPHVFVAREWLVLPGREEPEQGKLMLMHPNLDRLRIEIQQWYQGVIRMARSPGDDPVIVETWL